jgi:hypothetical protein
LITMAESVQMQRIGTGAEVFQSTGRLIWPTRDSCSVKIIIVGEQYG